MALDDAAVQKMKKIGLRALARGGAALVDSAGADAEELLGDLGALIGIGRKKLKQIIPPPGDEK